MAFLKQFPIPDFPPVRRLKFDVPWLVALSFLVLAGGCGRFHKENQDMVYVWTRPIYLRDRVAEVSNRVVEVQNAQELVVLEHGRRFLKVKTEKNQVGWIPERAVIDSKTYEGFVQLAKQHKNDLVVATGTLQDEIYLHLTPGRETDRFYLLPDNDKVELLMRASVPKNATPVAREALRRQVPPTAGPRRVSESRERAEQAALNADLPGEPATPPVVMEDWWLVRDGAGRTGWLLGKGIYVNVPDDVAQYAEGQHIVGAYEIATVNDPDGPGTDHEMPEYVMALSEPKAGLPYDFDQIRVFTWSLRHHRYETAYRLHPIQGYLPIRISSEPAPGGTEPVFSFQISTSPDVAINPDTGIAKPIDPRTVSFALRETMVRRVGPDLAPIPLKHEEDEKRSEKTAKRQH